MRRTLFPLVSEIRVIFLLITHHHSLFSIHSSCKFIPTIPIILRLDLVLFFFLISYNPSPNIKLHSSYKFLPSLQQLSHCSMLSDSTSLITRTHIPRSRINISLAAILEPVLCNRSAICIPGTVRVFCKQSLSVVAL